MLPPLFPRRVVFALVLLLCARVANAQPPQPATGSEAPGAVVTCAEMEDFLRRAKIVRQRSIPVGVTNPVRATLDDGRLRHDAALQTVDIRKPWAGGRRAEVNFRDSWQFNVAGYELAKMLSLNMVPPYVERRLHSGPGSVCWWIDGAMMERERQAQKIEPPTASYWEGQMSAVRLFHELIADTDLNMTNMLITGDWRLWMIDFTRAFRTRKTIDVRPLVRVDRRLLAAVRALTRERLDEQLGRWLNAGEIEALLARRDRIVEHFDSAIAARGEAVALYDCPRTAEQCGEGLH
jgi:hypothetical protein